MTRRNSTLVIRRSNTGLGLYAAVDIPKGTRIIQYTGERIANDDTAKYKGRYLFKLDDEYTIDGSTRKNLARYVNHSCRPNAYTEIIDGEIWIIAKRKIKASEEITYHYGKEYFNFFIKPKGCQCIKCNPEEFYFQQET
jgi:SET domain-containing protein